MFDVSESDSDGAGRRIARRQWGRPVEVALWLMRLRQLGTCMYCSIEWLDHPSAT